MPRRTAPRRSPRRASASPRARSRSTARRPARGHEWSWNPTCRIDLSDGTEERSFGGPLALLGAVIALELVAYVVQVLCRLRLGLALAVGVRLELEDLAVVALELDAVGPAR